MDEIDCIRRLQRGDAAARQPSGVQGGQLTLVNMRVTDAHWVLEFRGDGRAITFSGGPRPRTRAEDYSRVRLLGEYTVELDGRTGEVYGIRQTGVAPDISRAGLEHYRGPDSHRWRWPDHPPGQC